MGECSKNMMGMWPGKPGEVKKDADMRGSLAVAKAPRLSLANSPPNGVRAVVFPAAGIRCTAPIPRSVWSPVCMPGLMFYC